MPRYYVPPVPGASQVSTRPLGRPLLLATGWPLVAGLLLQPGHQALSFVAGGGLFLLYMLLLGLLSPYVLGLGMLLLLLVRLDRRRSRPGPPRPGPTWHWQPWEIVLSLAVLLLAVLYYAVVDGSRWVQRRWRKQKPRRTGAWKALAVGVASERSHPLGP